MAYSDVVLNGVSALRMMSLFVSANVRRRSFDMWQEAFARYLEGMYDLLLSVFRGWSFRIGDVVSYSDFCAFVYHYSSKEIPELFLTNE